MGYCAGRTGKWLAHFVRAALFAVLVPLLLSNGPRPAGAEDGHTYAQPAYIPSTSAQDDRQGNRERAAALWTGADALANSWSVYAGASYALNSRYDESGWRLTGSGGYGQYRYSRFVDAGGRIVKRRFTGHKAFSDLLIGYQFQWDWTTVKIFAGANSEHHRIRPDDPAAHVEDAAYGAKVAGEIWHWTTRRHWVAAYASYATTFSTYKGELRTGYRVLPDLDLGIEARIEGNDDYDGARAGAIAMFHADNMTFSAAGGIAGDRDGATSPYVSLGLFVRF